MPRIAKTIEIEGQPVAALFDTEAIYSYVLSRLVGHVPKITVAPPVRVGVGRRPIEIRECCIVEGKIEGFDFTTDAVVLEDLGWADGYDLAAIIGRRSMDQWEMRLDPRSGTLDLEGLRRREFTEYWTEEPRHGHHVSGTPRG